MAYAYTGTVLAAPLAERDDKPSLPARIMQALTESRQRSAENALRARGFVIDENGLVLEGLAKVSLARSGELPFVR